MKYRVLRIEGEREYVEQIVTGTPKEGWKAREWVTESHARGQAKILSHNHPKLHYEIQNDHYEPIAVYHKGEEI
jgi:hypothetical protein